MVQIGTGWPQICQNQLAALKVGHFSNSLVEESPRTEDASSKGGPIPQDLSDVGLNSRKVLVVPE